MGLGFFPFQIRKQWVELAWMKQDDKRSSGECWGMKRWWDCLIVVHEFELGFDFGRKKERHGK